MILINVLSLVTVAAVERQSAAVIEYEMPIAAPTASQRLIRDLLDPERYDRRAKPVSGKRPVEIVMRLNLYQILDVIEPTQTIELYTWATQMWKDEHLVWNPAEYDGITEIVLPYESVWLPDTYLYNSVQMSQQDSERPISVTVSTNYEQGHANIRFMYPAIYRFSCKLQVQYFPFDLQNCTMTFGSWTHDSSDIVYNLEQENVLTESYVTNAEWNLLSFTWHRETVNFSCCPHPWILLHAHLVVQRKPLFYLVNLVLPSAIIMMVATVGFFMPATTNGERTEKVNLGITTLLAMAILLLMVSDAMPTTSDFIPLLGWFYLNVILLTSIGTLLTSVVIWLQSQARFGAPVWNRIRRPCFRPMAGWLRVRPRPELVAYWLAFGFDSTGVKRKKKSPEKAQQSMAFAQTQETIILRKTSSMKVDTVDETSTPGSMPVFAQGPFDELINEADAIRFEWEHLAEICDRLLLLIFTIAVLAVTMSIFVTGLFLNE